MPNITEVATPEAPPLLFVRKEAPELDEIIEFDNKLELAATLSNRPTTCLTSGRTHSTIHGHVGSLYWDYDFPLTPSSSHLVSGNGTRRSHTFTELPELTVISFASVAPPTSRPSATKQGREQQQQSLEVLSELELMQAMPSVRRAVSPGTPGGRGPSFNDENTPCSDPRRVHHREGSGVSSPGSDTIVAVHVPRLRGDASQPTTQLPNRRRRSSKSKNERDNKKSPLKGKGSFASSTTSRDEPLLLPPLVMPPDGVVLRFGPRASSLSQQSAAAQRARLGGSSILASRQRPNQQARAHGRASVSFAQPTYSSLRHQGQATEQHGRREYRDGAAAEAYPTGYRRNSLQSPGTLSLNTMATSMGLHNNNNNSSNHFLLEPGIVTPIGSQTGGHAGRGNSGAASRRLFSSESRVDEVPDTGRPSRAMTAAQRTHSAALQNQSVHHAAMIPQHVIRERQVQYMQHVKSDVLRKLRQEHGDLLVAHEMRSLPLQRPTTAASKSKRLHAPWSLCSVTLPPAPSNLQRSTSNNNNNNNNSSSHVLSNFVASMLKLSLPIPTLRSKRSRSSKDVSLSPDQSRMINGGSSVVAARAISPLRAGRGPLDVTSNAGGVGLGLYATPTASWVAKAHAKGVVSAVVGIPPQQQSPFPATFVSIRSYGGYSRMTSTNFPGGVGPNQSHTTMTLAAPFGDELSTQPPTQVGSEFGSEQGDGNPHHLGMLTGYNEATAGFKFQQQQTAALLEKIEALFRATSGDQLLQQQQQFSRQVSGYNNNDSRSASKLADQGDAQMEGRKGNTASSLFTTAAAASSNIKSLHGSTNSANNNNNNNNSTNHHVQNAVPSRRYAQSNIFERLAVTGTGAIPVAAPSRSLNRPAILLTTPQGGTRTADDQHNNPAAAQAVSAGAIARISTAVAPHAVRDTISAQWMSGLREHTSTLESTPMNHTNSSNSLVRPKGAAASSTKSGAKSVWDRLYKLRPEPAPAPPPTVSPTPMHHSHHPVPSTSTTGSVLVQITPPKKAADSVASRVQQFRMQSLQTIPQQHTTTTATTTVQPSHNSKGASRSLNSELARHADVNGESAPREAFRRSQSPPHRGLSSPHVNHHATTGGGGVNGAPPAMLATRPQPHPASGARAPVDSLLDDDWTKDPTVSSTSFVLSPHGTSWSRNLRQMMNGTGAPPSMPAPLPRASVPIVSLASLPSGYQLTPQESGSRLTTPVERDDTVRRVTSPMAIASKSLTFVDPQNLLTVASVANHPTRSLPLVRKPSGITDIPHSRTNSYIAAAPIAAPAAPSRSPLPFSEVRPSLSDPHNAVDIGIATPTGTPTAEAPRAVPVVAPLDFSRLRRRH